MIRRGWRRFRPRTVLHKNVLRIVQPKHARTKLWQQAREQVHEMFPGRQIRDDAMIRAIRSARDRATTTNDPLWWCVALILQAPRAAAAQEQMDQHPHGYHNKQARLYELIDFNDTYVSAVLSLPEGQLPHFADEAKRAMDVFCKQLRTRCLSNEQYEAIVHGLSREIAVFRGAQAEGFRVHMTSRAEDALGIDMVITDPESGHSINVDCKTHSAFYYRLRDLTREGRLTTEQAAEAEDRGHAWVINRDDVRGEVRIAVWRIDQQTYGNIQYFSLESTTVLGQKIREMLHDSMKFAVGASALTADDAAILEERSQL